MVYLLFFADSHFSEENIEKRYVLIRSEYI